MSAIRKKHSQPDFEIRIVGPGISPWGVPVRSLSRILNAVQRLIEHTEEDEFEGAEAEQIESRPPIHLIAVKKGSARYGVLSEAAPLALDTIVLTGQYLRDPSASDWEPAILSPIEELSAVARSLQGWVEFRRPGKDGEILAVVTKDSYEELSRVAFVSGESTVGGYLERVGGATSYFCGLRLPNQHAKMIICPVHSQDLVRQLGQHVYENVRVSGTVTWFRRNWRVKRIYVKSFEQAKEGSISQALERVYEAGARAWDGIDDVQGFIFGMRKA